MWDRINKWFVKVFFTKYIIVRNGLLLWQVFYPDRTVTNHRLAQSELLSQVNLVCSFTFSRIINRAYTTNGLLSFLLIRYLIWKHGRSFKFKRIKATEVVYLSDLTGIKKTLKKC